MPTQQQVIDKIDQDAGMVEKQSTECNKKFSEKPSAIDAKINKCGQKRNRWCGNFTRL
jgi:hypothetical protein